MLAAESDGGKSKQNKWKYSLYGALSGATARTAVAPFERLKILLEVSHGFKSMRFGILHWLSERGCYV